MDDVIALIPARGGSKGVPRKNIALLGGYPLIAFAIAAAKLSRHIPRVIVSTEDEEIAEIARKFGAEVPFMRPKELAGDSSADIEWVQHAIAWLKEHEGVVPEYLVQLRVTTPLRVPHVVDEAIELIKARPEATSLRSSHEIRESPYKLFGVTKDGFHTGLYPDDPRPEYYNLPRQVFPLVYQPNGYVDILKASHIERTGNQHGDKILAFPTPDTGEIDAPEHFVFLRFMFEQEKWEVYEWLTKNFPLV